MSNSKVDNDGFQVVKFKRNHKNKQTKIPSKDIKFIKTDINIDVDTVLGRISAAIEELGDSKYLEDCLKYVSTVLQSRTVVEIVCFGLGHIGECNISKFQLSFLLCLKNLYKPEKVLVHDPVFYKDECEVLKCLGLEVIEKNSEGSYIISDKQVTIVYLPHCPKQLTNNFLWSNWGPNLHNCILICNSFTSLNENQPSRILSEIVPYIHKIFPYTSEIILENNFKFTDIFNDTSLHYLPKEILDKINSEFWIKADQPKYENSEEFITSLMIEKLNI